MHVLVVQRAAVYTDTGLLTGLQRLAEHVANEYRTGADGPELHPRVAAYWHSH